MTSIFDTLTSPQDINGGEEVSGELLTFYKLQKKFPGAI